MKVHFDVPVTKILGTNAKKLMHMQWSHFYTCSTYTTKYDNFYKYDILVSRIDFRLCASTIVFVTYRKICKNLTRD